MGSVLFSDNQDLSSGLWEFNVSVLEFYLLLKNKPEEIKTHLGFPVVILPARSSLFARLAVLPPYQGPQYLSSFSGMGHPTAYPPVEDGLSPSFLSLLSLSTCSVVTFPPPIKASPCGQ